jgi:ATP-dependent DNA helicase RecG
VGKLPARRRREILEGIATGEVDVAVGTHALIQGDVEFADLGLVVVDEQHRFGVLQRANLGMKGRRPDALFMTATPIPRTLSLTAFGDLDVSVIDELPPGRKPARTLRFPRDRIEEAYEFIRSEIGKGRQAYFIFPLVEESEEMPLKAVTEEVSRLREEVFPGIPIGLIHGRMKREEKDRAMRRFRDAEDKVLAATTVVEVGVDVPNATVMVVEHAERYGLSQLHQLRGRIGRGGGESTFLLLGDPTTEEGHRRLEVLTETTDGFRIAEEDLRLRGPGEVFGTRQHGLPDLKIASLVGDLRVLERARKDAFALVARDPKLAGPQGAPVRAALIRRLGDRMGLVQA